MNKGCPNRRGVALILVLLMISVIITVTLQLNRSSRVEVYEAANLSDGILLRAIAESAFHAGAAILLADRNAAYDALTEPWANTEMLALKSEDLFDRGSFRIIIEDEGGKIPINRLVGTGGARNQAIQDLLVRLLTGPYFRLEKRKAEDLLDAIKDWIDPDDDVTGFGAEGAYYAGLPRPYAAKNASLDCIEELLMIKGMSAELFYGTAESPGLVQCLTVFGEAPDKINININTAPKPVLLALAEGMTAKEVALIEEYRRDERNDLANPTWYTKFMPAGISVQPGLTIVVVSNIFRVTAIGLQGRMMERITGVVKRGAVTDQQKIKLLAWKVD